MADDWTKLWKEWDGSETGFVAEVDCTTIENEELCNKFNIKGYPTLLYGNTSSLKKYTGEIFFDELSDFAKQNLKPKEPTAVIDLTPDNYESMTNGKTIFVKFFAVSISSLCVHPNIIESNNYSYLYFCQLFQALVSM